MALAETWLTFAYSNINQCWKNHMGLLSCQIPNYHNVIGLFMNQPQILKKK